MGIIGIGLNPIQPVSLQEEGELDTHTQGDAVWRRRHVDTREQAMWRWRWRLELCYWTKEALGLEEAWWGKEGSFLRGFCWHLYFRLLGSRSDTQYTPVINAEKAFTCIDWVADSGFACVSHSPKPKIFPQLHTVQSFLGTQDLNFTRENIS